MGQSTKEAIRHTLSRVVVLSGLSRIARLARPKDGCIVLMGHRVSGDDEGYLQGIRSDWFKAQMEYLANNFEIIPLSTLVACWAQGTEPPNNSVTITFDDGFRDNYTTAFPTLLQLGIPATVFLVTGSIDTGQLPWPQRLGCLVQRTSASSICHQLTGHHERSLESAEDKKLTYSGMKRVLGTLGASDRERALQSLQSTLRVIAPEDQVLTWKQVAEMAGSGLVEFGGHTVSHPWLDHLGEAEARGEVEGCRDRMMEKLGGGPRPFAFPAGRFTSRDLRLVRAARFSSCFQSQRGIRLNSPKRVGDPFALSRVGLPTGPSYLLEAELDGPFHTLRGLYRH